MQSFSFHSPPCHFQSATVFSAVGGMTTTTSCSPSNITVKSTAKQDKNDNHWGNKVQFILSTIGLAVGIENWRYPGLAYENGGSAFLIAYVTCGFVFGLPVMYAEFIIGQYTQANPAKAYYLYAPGFAGVGLAAIITCTLVAVFYAVVISWSMLYLGFTIAGQSYKWTRCDNWWNTENCVESSANVHCFNRNKDFPYAYKGSCYAAPVENTTNGAEQFFINYVTPRSNGITEFGHFNVPVALCLIILYTMCAATNIKGIKFLGKLSYVTVPLPFIVVLILFVRGLFLDGALDGVEHYLFKPDMSKLLSFQTWMAAAKQVCFSLALGMGALISLASHNEKRNNCFKDALTVIIFDTVMSVLGGMAVFSILGYLAKQTGKKITDVVQDGPSLVFIVYPETMATMPSSWLWNALFFAMFFPLGFTSIVVIMDFLCSFVCTSFPSIKRKWTLPILLSSGLCLSGILVATGAGYYWFNLMVDFTATTSPVAVITLELVLFYVYGWTNFCKDLEDLFGPRPKFLLSYLFSKQSPYFFVCWALICPAIALLCCGLSLDREVPMSIGKYVLPIWAEVIGWFLNLGPLLAIPICAFVQYLRMRQKGLGFADLFRLAREHPSYGRIYRLEDTESSEGFNGEEESTTETQETLSA